MTANITDYLVLLFYLSIIFTIAFYSKKKKYGNSDVNDQYLASKSLTFTESICSIIATEVSALTFLGIPSFTLGKDYSFVQIYFGAIIGRVFIAKLMLPLIYDKGLTIYSVMGQGGSHNGQRAIASFYALNKFLAVGVRLFSGSILVAEFFNIGIYMAVFLICCLTFVYTLIGGLKAVVRTDMLQMALFISGGIIAHYLIPLNSEYTWSELISQASIAGKTSFIDFQNLTPFIIGVLGGILFDMSTHGVDQDFVQRLTANHSLKRAQQAIFLSGFLSVAVGFLFLSIGALLWAFYQHTPMPQMPNDKVFAYFITQYFPVGIKGLMVAGVLAATMSTLDSTINALSSTFHADIFQRKVASEKLKTIFRNDTLLITFILMIVAFIASKSDGVLLLGLKITSWTAGSLLAIFFATVVLRISKISTQLVLGAYITGPALVALNTFVLKWDWNFNVYLGFGTSLIFCYLYSKLAQQATP